MLTIGSLFSGIGGLELGLEWAGLGPVRWQVEQNPFCLRKLAWRYPDASRYTDVRTVGASNLAPVDLICGGFPCQDISSAGKRAGLTGARSGLWHEFARIVAECRPQWVVVENVRSGASKWVDAVRGDLEQLGYATLPLPIAASDCGAPHERARVFIVGHAADCEGFRREATRLPSRATSQVSDAGVGLAHGANTNGVTSIVRTEARKEGSDARWHRGWATEPALARVVHGLPGRVDYERALGNAVVPQCAEVVGHVILQLMREAA